MEAGIDSFTDERTWALSHVWLCNKGTFDRPNNCSSSADGSGVSLVNSGEVDGTAIELMSVFIIVSVENKDGVNWSTIGATSSKCHELCRSKGELFSDSSAECLSSSGLFCVAHCWGRFRHSFLLSRRRRRLLANQFFSYNNNTKKQRIRILIQKTSILGYSHVAEFRDHMRSTLWWLMGSSCISFIPDFADLRSLQFLTRTARGHMHGWLA